MEERIEQLEGQVKDMRFAVVYCVVSVMIIAGITLADSLLELKTTHKKNKEIKANLKRIQAVKDNLEEMIDKKMMASQDETLLQ